MEAAQDMLYRLVGGNAYTLYRCCTVHAILYSYDRNPLLDCTVEASLAREEIYNAQLLQCIVSANSLMSTFIFKAEDQCLKGLSHEMDLAFDDM
jgi:hypothetical protein